MEHQRLTHPAIASALAAWRKNRSDFQSLLEQRFQQADDDLCGYLLNNRGRAKAIDAISLFYGPWSRVKAYANEELIAWFEVYGRITFEDYESALTGYPGHHWGELIRDWGNWQDLV